ncbi:MAG: hypothetical protein HYR60_30520 [Acidobacteria bacterium]|nr:hypothetical protein [Acidobacteriota bacterium]MBI3473646.1 hypothetical protein [Candidatus Solibacter usitatus]
MSKINSVVSQLVAKCGLSAQEARALTVALASQPPQNLDAEIAMLRRVINGYTQMTPIEMDWTRDVTRRIVTAYSQLQGFRDWKPDRINPYVVEVLLSYAASMVNVPAAINAARVLANTTEEAFLKLRPELTPPDAGWAIDAILEKAADLMGRGQQTPLQAAEEIVQRLHKRR